jgi:hypothetical protein
VPIPVQKTNKDAWPFSLSLDAIVNLPPDPNPWVVPAAKNENAILYDSPPIKTLVARRSTISSFFVR